MADFNEVEAHQIAKERMLRKDYIPPMPPDADRVKELYYTSDQIGWVDRPLYDQQGNLVATERTAGDLPQKLKDDYYWLINKGYATGIIDDRDKRIDELETMLATIFFDACKSKNERTINDVLEQQAALMIHGTQLNMSKGGFNRQMSSTITQLQGQFYKVGKSMKDMMG